MFICGSRSAMNIVYTILSIIGAVGLFIFGMKIMSEGIQRFAGKAMQSIVNKVASSTFKGILTGFLTTSLIQSSSAATVMIVSFANAGIFKLRQAISLIMGANIGTTVTAWLFLVFGFSKIGVSGYMWPLLAIATPLVFIRRNNLQLLGRVLFGFCIMFLGLGQLKLFFQALSLQENNEFLSFLYGLSEMGMVSILLFIFIGTVLTIIVQSSTVAMGFTLAFCSSGLPLELGIALVLGENLGTTSTANIAALVANIHGKRAARAHTLFNLISIAWFLIFYYPLVNLVDTVISWSNLGSPLQNSKPEALAAALAFTHTFVNITNTILTAPFIGKIEQFICKISKAKNQKDEEYNLSYMEQGITSTSGLYVLEAKKQLVMFAIMLRKMSEYVNQLIANPDPDLNEDLFVKLEHYEKVTHKVQEEVSTYLAKISANDLSESMALDLKTMLFVVNEMERCAIKFLEMSSIIKEKNTENIWFNSTQRESLKSLFILLDKALDLMYQKLKHSNTSSNESNHLQILTQISGQFKQYKADYLKEMTQANMHIKSGLFYYELLNLCDKISKHIGQISSRKI
jgi:phosphate:Na+ symporter